MSTIEQQKARRREASRRYRERHPDRVKAAKAAWDAKNPGYYVEKAREVRKERPEHVAAIRRRNRYGVDAPRPAPPTCEACDGPYNVNHGPCFDHDHKTGAFRGWLCNDCNVVLGRVKDDPSRLRKLAAYLEKTCSSV